jgi:Phage protein Gp138 N-terminal domain
MISGNEPDIDPANNDTLAGTIQFAFFKLMQGVNGMLPAQVIAYDRVNNRVQVQLMIAVVTTSGAQVSRPQVASIPVLLLGGGNFFLSYNLNAGDLGWVIANDRDISLFLQNYSEAAPNTARVKNFADGLFVPSVMTNYIIASEDKENAVLQSIDGTVKISLGTGQIKVAAPIVIVESPNVQLGDGTLTALMNGSAMTIYNEHTHASPSAPPVPLMTSSNLTTDTTAS